MIGELFSALVFKPLYNGLIFLVSWVPYGDVGIAVIVLTIAVKFLVFPLSIKAVRTQIVMRELEEPLKKIKEKHATDRQAQAQAVMELYKTKGVNPFSSLLLILIQIPIIFGLYWVFYRGGLPTLNEAWLYAFTSRPDIISMEFLGFIDMASKSIGLALIAGVTQYIQAKLTFPALPQRSSTDAPSLKDDFARSMHLNMRYVFPVFMAVFAYLISAAVALYLVTSNIFAIGQELYVRKNIRPKDNTTHD